MKAFWLEKNLNILKQSESEWLFFEIKNQNLFFNGEEDF